MDIGEAIKAARSGQRIARRGWNGQGMFVYYVPPGCYPPTTEIAERAFGGRMVPYREYLALVTTQGDVATWAPSCSDTLADDWTVLG